MFSERNGLIATHHCLSVFVENMKGSAAAGAGGGAAGSGRVSVTMSATTPQINPIVPPMAPSIPRMFPGRRGAGVGGGTGYPGPVDGYGTGCCCWPCGGAGAYPVYVMPCTTSVINPR